MTSSPFYDLPKEQVDQLKQFRQDSNRSAGDLQSSYMQGTDAPSSLLGSNPQYQQTQGMTGLDPGLSQALEQRANGKYTQNMGLLNVQAKHDSLNDRFNRLQQAADLTSQELAHNEAVRQAKYMDRMNRKRARAAVLGNILGIGGAVGGGVIGGPMGAAAGYQIGQGAGAMAGQ